MCYITECLKLKYGWIMDISEPGLRTREKWQGGR